MQKATLPEGLLPFDLIEPGPPPHFKNSDVTPHQLHEFMCANPPEEIERFLKAKDLSILHLVQGSRYVMWMAMSEEERTRLGGIFMAMLEELRGPMQ